MSSRYDFDLFVIGAGSGGVRAARLAAQKGARVGIAEEYRFGGTCVIRGCIPKKLFVYASHYAEEFIDAVGFGWTVGGASFDWTTLVANKDKEVARLEGLYRKGLESAGAQPFHERALLKDPHTIHLQHSNRDVTADTVLVATGSRPSRDTGAAGAECCITSEEAFDFDRLPKSIVVAGGGYVALEFAHIFHGLGTEVTLIYRGPKVLRGFDEDLRDAIQKSMRKKGIGLVMNTTFAWCERAGERVVGYTRDGKALEAEQIMLAIGREPNTRDMGLDAAGVALGHRGAVLVDEYLRSNVPNIYAVGDVNGAPELTPVAIHEAMCFVRTVFDGVPTPRDLEFVPTAVFTNPEVGTVGLSEGDALARGHSVDVYKSTFKPLRHTLSGRDERVMMKLVADAKTDKVLGCHIFGPDAGELVQLVAIALKMGATKAQFDSTVAVHPTMAEELVTMYTKTSR